MNSSSPANRLAQETSPYLLQHAHNPVDWYPWGEEAFATARSRQMPIFLSVGYSACHWCHVMERESFENPRIAALMNEQFINVKVDREERPEIDQIYMSAVQLITGQGGWPMSVFLTPEGAPFFGGTYWPPVSRHGMPGFTDILTKLSQFWQGNRDECIQKGSELVEAINQLHHQEQARNPLQLELLQHAQHRLMQSADREQGGFGNVPKFPHPVDLRVLLRCWKRFGNSEVLQTVRLTLDKMAAGGIYDQLGGGFARYATDRFWLVPHFEKMLYDNAQLVPVYLEGWQATGDADYLRVARESLDYVLREMTSPEGSFYSTQDADSEGEEGKFYVWSEAEIQECLGAEAAALFMNCYSVTAGGNWEGHNILHRQHSWEKLANATGKSVAQLQLELRASAEKLLARRSQRVWPDRDDKQIVAWNGLMLSAFSRAAHLLEDETYRQTALQAGHFLLEKLRKPDGSLWHCRNQGENRFNGFLDDYACLIEGLCDLFMATLEPFALQGATDLTDKMLARFYDSDTQAFHYTPDDHEPLIVRVRDRYDSAIPSGTNLAIHALLRVAQLTDRGDWREIAAGCLEAVSGTVRQQPSGMGQALLALDQLLGPVYETILVTEAATDSASESQQLRSQLKSQYLPRHLVLTPTESQLREMSFEQSSLLAGKQTLQAEPTFYLCRQGVCEAPVQGRELIGQQLVALPD